MNRFAKWIYLAFGFSMLVLFIISLNYYRRLEKSEFYINRISHTSNTLLVLEWVNGLFQRSANAFRNYLITGNDIYLKEENKDWRLVEHKIDSLYKLTADDPSQQQLVERLRTTGKYRKELVDKLVTRFRKDSTVDVNYFMQLEAVKNNFEVILADVSRQETRLLEERKTIKNKFENYSYLFLAFLLGFTGLILAASFYSLLRALKKRSYFEKQLREKIVTLNMANKELENLSRATSHHVQEPLRKIRNLSSLLRQRQNQLNYNDASLLLEKIENNAANLQTLAQNLVEYANLIQCSQEKEKLSPELVIRQVEDHLEDRIILQHATITVKELPEILAVPSQVFILFSELLANALSFTSADRPVQITIYSQEHQAVTSIIVEDNGVGFSPEYGDRIFRLFERLEPIATGGRGVGLAMCARIMANHGGSIRAEGRSGLGARFILDFPRE